MQTKTLLPSDPPRETDSSEEDAALSAPRRRIASRVVVVCAAAAGAALLLGRSWGGARARGAAPAAIGLAEEAPALKETPEVAGVGALPPRLCTDGWMFSFSALVSVKGEGEVDLLTSSEGALKLTAKAGDGYGDVTFSLSTFDYGAVSVSAPLRGDGVVTVRKTDQGICLRAGTELEEVCNYPSPEEVPQSGFQMKPVGDLMLGQAAAAVEISEFEQSEGFVPVSLGLSGVTFDQLYKHEAEYEKFRAAVGETIAYVAGDGVAPDEVHSFLAAGEEGTAVVQSTIVSPARETGMACKVQDAVASAISSGYLGAVLKERLGAAGAAYAAAVVSGAAPAAPMATEAAPCRHTERREIVEGSKCLGFGCIQTACEEASPEAEKEEALRPLPETAARASAGAPVTETFGRAVDWKGFKVEKEEAPMTAWEPAGHDWKELAAQDSFKDSIKVGDLHTDGLKVDFEVDLEFSPGAFATKQVVLVAEPGDGLTLSTVRTALAGKGTLRLEGSLLGGLGHGGCSVESAPVDVGSKVTVRVTRDQEQCCVSVSGEQQCAKRGPSAKDFQMRPGDRVMQPRGLRSVSVSGYKEHSASMTMSFSVSHVKYDDIIGKCNCLDEVVAAIKQSVAYWGPLGTTEDQVSVTLKRSAAFDKTLPELSERELVRLHRAFQDRLELRGPTVSKDQELLKHLREEVIKRIETGEDQHEEEHFKRRLAGVPGAPEPTRSVHRFAGAPSGYVAALLDAAKEVDPSFDGTGIDALAVQITLSGCNGHCGSTRDALLAPKFASIVSERLLTVVGRPVRGATTGAVSVAEVSCPAEVTTCAQVTCDGEYFTNTHPNMPCFGGEGCQKKCCRPRTCAEVHCKAPLKKVWGHGAMFKTCTNEEECLDTCCVQSCVGVPCFGDSVCPKHDAWMLWSKPSELQETCCYQKDPKCGTAHTAWCASCHMCMKPKSYCKKAIHHAAPHAFARRLRGEDDGDDQEVAAAPVEAEAAARQFTAEEMEADLREAEENLNGLMNITSASGNLQGRRLTGIEAKRAAMQTKLLSDAIRRVRAESRSGGLKTKKKVRGESTKGAKKWNAALKTAKHKAPGFIPGCGAPGGALACKYYLESVFTMGRCHGPSSVNTVAILTDTLHAVSCGSDGICWVWKIKTGVPISVWVPDALCDTGARAPVRTVTPFHDATYILSAGQKTQDPADGGVAYIWDWRKGFGIKKFTCADGAYLSSSNIPLWRMFLLGCSDGFITVKNWATGNELQLPYHAKTAEEVRSNIAGRLENFLENNVDGIVRLKIVKQAEKVGSLRQAFDEAHPELAEKIEEAVEAGDKAFNFVNGNYFGAVEAIAYAPTGQRFVSGHADGNMRLWDAASGTLLRIMRHSRYGRVNAVATFPNTCNAASGGDDGIVRIWELESGLQVCKLDQMYGGPVRTVQVVPGGKQVVVGSDDGYVRIWEVEKECRLLCAFWVSHSTITSIAVNPSNPLKQIVVASADGLVRVFNPYKGGVDSLELDGR